MDDARFDALARRIDESRSRRGALRVALAATVGAALATVASPREDAAARRHACQVRCGADRRLCRADCQIKSGVSEKQCKRTCNAWRERCFEHCEFKPLGRRLAPHDRGLAETRKRRLTGASRAPSGVSRGP